MSTSNSTKELDLCKFLSGEIEHPVLENAIENPPTGTTLVDTLPTWAKDQLKVTADEHLIGVCDFCNAVEKEQKFKMCAQCKSGKSEEPAVYCGKKCQEVHWPTHKVICKKRARTERGSGKASRNPKYQASQQLHRWQKVHEEVLLWFVRHAYYTNPEIDPSKTFLHITLNSHPDQDNLHGIPLLWPMLLVIQPRNVSRGWDPILTRELPEGTGHVWFCYELATSSICDGVSVESIYPQKVSSSDWRKDFDKAVELTPEYLMVLFSVCLSHSRWTYEATMKPRLLKYGLYVVRANYRDPVTQGLMRKYAVFPDFKEQKLGMVLYDESWVNMLTGMNMWAMLESLEGMQLAFASENGQLSYMETWSLILRAMIYDGGSGGV